MNQDLPLHALAELATERLTRGDQFARKLAWWLTGGHAAERWLQFEWAYCLWQELDRSEHLVVCEHKSKDVVILHREASLEGNNKVNPVEAGFEIKWFGNWWYAKKQSLDLQKDIDKVRGYPFPAAALVFLLFAEPDPLVPEHAWIKEQVDRGSGARSVEELIEVHMEGIGGLQPNRRFDFTLQLPDGFIRMSLHLLLFGPHFMANLGNQRSAAPE